MATRTARSISGTFETHTGHFLSGRHYGGKVVGIQMIANDRWLTSWGQDNTTLLWDRDRDQPALTLTGRLLRGPADGRRLAVVLDQQFHVREWTASVCRIRRLPEKYAEFDPAGRWLAVAGFGGVQLLDTDTLQTRAELGLDPCGPPAFRPDGKELITFGLFSQAQCWPIEPDGTGRPTRIGPPPKWFRKQASWRHSCLSSNRNVEASTPRGAVRARCSSWPITGIPRYWSPTLLGRGAFASCAAAGNTPRRGQPRWGVGCRCRL